MQSVPGMENIWSRAAKGIVGAPGRNMKNAYEMMGKSLAATSMVHRQKMLSKAEEKAAKAGAQAMGREATASMFGSIIGGFGDFATAGIGAYRNKTGVFAPKPAPGEISPSSAALIDRYSVSSLPSYSFGGFG